MKQLLRRYILIQKEICTAQSLAAYNRGDQESVRIYAEQGEVWRKMLHAVAVDIKTLKTLIAEAEAAHPELVSEDYRGT